MEKYGILTLQDYQKQIENCVSCYCGLCNKNCPAYMDFRNAAVSPRGLSEVALALSQGEYEISDLSDEILYACVGCRACEWYCSENVYVQVKTRNTLVSPATIAEIFRSMKVESGSIHSKVRDALNNMVKHGNPYGGLSGLKDEWVSGLGLKDTRSETILFVGSLVPYEDNATAMSEAIVDVLKMADIDFTILGSEEMDSGAHARMMGEEGLFEEMVERTLELLETNKIKKIICVSPHDFDTFVNYYEGIGHIEIIHYTQLLWELIGNGKINLKNKLEKNVAYHDPCYLGRRGGIYDEPRNILRSIPGLHLVELELSKENAFCCGGGGTGLWLELPAIHIDLQRADQINNTGVECLAVACPICYTMLDAAMTSREYKIEVKDIAQLVKESLT